MLQHVNSVLVGKFPTTYTNVDALNVGEIAMFNQDGALLTTEAAVAVAYAIAIGSVHPRAGTSSSLRISR